LLCTESHSDCIFNYSQGQLFELENIYYSRIIIDSQRHYQYLENFLVWKDLLSKWHLSAVHFDIILNGLFLFAVVPWTGQLVCTLTRVFFLISLIFMPQFVHEYGKYRARNSTSFNHDHLIVITSSLWIRPGHNPMIFDTFCGVKKETAMVRNVVVVFFNCSPPTFKESYDSQKEWHVVFIIIYKTRIVIHFGRKGSSLELVIFFGHNHCYISLTIDTVARKKVHIFAYRQIKRTIFLYHKFWGF
jgi:hypothetical protein